MISGGRGKAPLDEGAADCLRNRETLLHSFATFTQLVGIDGNTLRAPEGEPDDRADAYALACVALGQARRQRALATGLPMTLGERPAFLPARPAMPRPRLW